MKSSVLAKQLGITEDKLAPIIKQFRNREKYANKIKPGTFSYYNIDDDVVNEVMADYHSFLQEQQQKQEEENDNTERKQIALSKMLITSGFNFDGYTITKYSGYISGDDAIQIDRGRQGWFSSSNVTNVGEALTKALVKIRRAALQELKEAAYALGCNAVIGVDYDYITLEPETANASGGTTYLPYVIAVTANGNAVVIEKNKDSAIIEADDDEIELTPM